MNEHNKSDYIINTGGNHLAAKWDSFLESSDTANFYQRYAWREINESSLGHKTYYIVAEKNGDIAGVFPLVFIESRLFGRFLTSMPFVNLGGPCSLDTDATTALIEEARRLTTSLGAKHLEIRTFNPVDGELPTSEHKVSMTLQLDADSQVLWNGFKSKHRNNIRRAYKQGLHVEIGHKNLLPVFYSIMACSWRSLGTPIYKEQYFESILDAFPDETRIFVAYLDDIPVATAFNGYYKGTVEGMWAGALPQYRRAQPNYVLYWEMIKHACEQGYTRYHLGRSTSGSSAEEFKKKWNAGATQLYWQYILNKRGEMPDLNVDNPKFRAAIAIWKKLPIQITTSIGPLIARNIP